MISRGRILTFAVIATLASVLVGNTSMINARQQLIGYAVAALFAAVSLKYVFQARRETGAFGGIGVLLMLADCAQLLMMAITVVSAGVSRIR